jgi:hypothetical protein
VRSRSRRSARSAARTNGLDGRGAAAIIMRRTNCEPPAVLDHRLRLILATIDGSRPLDRGVKTRDHPVPELATEAIGLFRGLNSGPTTDGRYTSSTQPDIGGCTRRLRSQSSPNHPTTVGGQPVARHGSTCAVCGCASVLLPSLSS